MKYFKKIYFLSFVFVICCNQFQNDIKDKKSIPNVENMIEGEIAKSDKDYFYFHNTYEYCAYTTIVDFEFEIRNSDGSSESRFFDCSNFNECGQGNYICEFDSNSVRAHKTYDRNFILELNI